MSNAPAYPKKLPIVLIATLATLMLSAGAIVTGELLRMTAPRAVAAFVSSPAMVRAPPAAEEVAMTGREPVFDVRPESRAEPAADIAQEMSPPVASELTEIETLAGDLPTPAKPPA